MKLLHALLPGSLTLSILALAMLMLSPAHARAAETLRIELNALESNAGKCRLSFVLENRGGDALQSLKLDLAVFNPAGIVGRSLVVEFGPIRKGKTIVKAFELDRDCAQIGALLVNDVAACVPGEPSACLDELVLSSRATDVRFYK